VQLKFFRVEAADPSIGEGELNKFLRGHRVLTIDKHLVQVSGCTPYWTVAVEYMEPVAEQGTSSASGKTDFKDLLNDQDFALFCRLKEVRKSIAEEAGVPVYSIFTNRHLADLAQRRCKDVAEVSKIHGVGKKRAEKNASALLDVITEFESNGTGSQDRRDVQPEGSIPEGLSGETRQA